MAIEITGDAEEELLGRIVKALEYAKNGVYDGAHHKDWALDQVVRALTGCPAEQKTALDWRSQPYTFEAQGENDDYRKFTRSAPGWSEGIAP
jgi:hypothetical protein